ncbi:RNA polymerase sigma factor [Rummeliibacillus pycnus]|uniref:RNA polymerase sigma factor n=1 Tax=Rummeliibacillus pycnus TaxID=101070 RepID=UPI001FE9F562|nr:RNA polymerase sigma factor [Rummeliibacillus pycnus]
MKNNEELMESFQQGNLGAFDLIYQQLYEPLYCFLFRYTCEEQLSIDIVHDTFERLHKVKSDYKRQKGTVKSYVFQIAYRLLINKLNRRKKWRTLLPFLVPSSVISYSSDEKLVIQQPITSLPEKQKAVILLTYYHDLTQEEIAQILSVPIGTVKSRLHHAMKTLKEELREDFYDERGIQ